MQDDTGFMGYARMSFQGASSRRRLGTSEMPEHRLRLASRTEAQTQTVSTSGVGHMNLEDM